MWRGTEWLLSWWWRSIIQKLSTNQKVKRMATTNPRQGSLSCRSGRRLIRSHIYSNCFPPKKTLTANLTKKQETRRRLQKDDRRIIWGVISRTASLYSFIKSSSNFFVYYNVSSFLGICAISYIILLHSLAGNSLTNQVLSVSHWRSCVKSWLRRARGTPFVLSCSLRACPVTASLQQCSLVHGELDGFRFRART